MKAYHLIPVLIFALTAGSRALTEEGRKVGDELVTALQEELTEVEGGDNGEIRAAAVKQYMRQVKAALAQDDNRSTSQYLENYGEYNPSKKIVEAVAGLKKAIKNEQQQKSQNMIQELQSILDSAKEKVARATEPEELDKILDTLSRAREGMNYNQGYESNNSVIQSLLSEIGNARQFVTSWQDYLQAVNSGNTSRASSSLRNIASQERVLIPRSQIIARMETERPSHEDAAKIIEAVKTPQDMKGAIAKLTTMQRATSNSSDSDSPEIRDSLRTLSRYEKIYQEATAGLPVNIESLGQSSDSSDLTRDLKFIQLRTNLLAQILPGILALPDDSKLTEGEKIDHYLTRAMQAAIARGDTAACRRIDKAAQVFVRTSTFSPSDTTALKCFEAGQSQMEAGQYALAVVSLQNALKSGSTFISPKKISEMLTRMEKEQPTEYADGMKKFQPLIE